MTKKLLAQALFMVNIALFASLCIGLAKNSEEPTATSVPSVELKEAVGFLKNPKIVFVDARPFGAYREKLIPTAVSLPMGQKPTPDLLEQLRRAEKLIVYCDGPDCKAADRVAQSLMDMKFTGIFILKAGMKGWEAAALPTQSVGKEAI